MRQVTEAEFNAILQDAKRDNEERASVGLAPLEVTTRSYGNMDGSCGLVEYFFAGTMFGFIQNGIHHSNGL
ncbi:hypothetical protein [Stutzerimonas stutzeri]|uniref:hypothetical protein n=1 Tax=Stutzerimonas stutzeri TaxID=316 RepID=UPI00265CEC2B|nr:hypothetical protein [Stutzerimonas stutzeri]MCF6783359.1 hypothetical protein [Stutzerimonas stutzeri]